MRMYSGQELVRELSQAFGPSGCEDGVRAFIRTQIGASCDGMTEDRAGNLIVRIAGRGMDYDPAQERRLMVSAHMDEVGFMVREITDEGYLKFSLIGQIDHGGRATRRQLRIGHELHRHRVRDGRYEGAVLLRAAHRRCDFPLYALTIQIQSP